MHPCSASISFIKSRRIVVLPEPLFPLINQKLLIGIWKLTPSRALVPVSWKIFVLQNVRWRTWSRKQGEKRSHRKLSENPSRRQFVYCVFGKEKFHKISDGVFGFRRIQPKQSRTIKFVIQNLKNLLAISPYISYNRKRFNTKIQLRGKIWARLQLIWFAISL